MLKTNTTLVLVFFALALIACSPKKSELKQTKSQPENSKPMKVLVGTYTAETSEGVYTLDFNTTDGTLSNPILVAKSESPSFVTQSKDGKYVFTVNETDPGVVSAYKWNADKTALLANGTQPSEGMHPCFVELNDDENLLAIANYSSGNIAVYDVNDGKLSASPQVKQHEGSGPKPQQQSAHAHCSKFSKDQKFLYVADLGIDKIVGYAIDENNQLGEKFTALQMGAGDGPRHFIYHPTKELVYIINEHSNSVTVASINVETGVLTKIDKQSTLPENFEGDSYCADIHISSNGKFLYGTNRGDNSIATFSVADDGTIQFVETVSVEGDWPRNFTLSPDEKFVLVANQKSDNITVFSRDTETGRLTFTGNEFKLSKPVCVKF